MSVFEKMKDEARTLDELIRSVLAMDTDELYGDARLHQLSFTSSGKNSFKMVFGLIEDLSQCNLDRIPANLLTPIKDRINTYKTIFEQAKALSIENNDNPKAQRDRIVSEIEGNYQALFTAVYQVINFANKAGTDFKQVEREVRQVLSEVNDYTTAMKKSLGERRKEAEQVLEAMRVAAAETGVSQNAIHYAEAQRKHAEEAADWKGNEKNLTIGLIAYVVVAAVIFALVKSDQKFSFGYLEVAATIVTLLWYRAIRRCTKNYNAEKHNEISNAYKARSLTTFRAFVDATENDSIKDQVLVQVSAAAFSPPSSGYISGESEVALPIPLTGALGRTISDAVTGRAGHA